MKSDKKYIELNYPDSYSIINNKNVCLPLCLGDDGCVYVDFSSVELEKLDALNDASIYAFKKISNQKTFIFRYLVYSNYEFNPLIYQLANIAPEVFFNVFSIPRYYNTHVTTNSNNLEFHKLLLKYLENPQNIITDYFYTNLKKQLRHQLTYFYLEVL